MLPRYAPSDGAGDHYFYNLSWAREMVAEYTGLNFLQVGELNYIQFLLWRRDAFIHRMEQSEAGREYLRNAWRMTQTKADRGKLRRKFGKESADNGK